MKIYQKRTLVIIVSYNGMRWINDCLSSIPSDSSIIEGLVIDNGSEDDTVKILKQKFPHVRIIETGKNLGFGAANNIGIRDALSRGYDYIYLLNQDAWIVPDDIVRLVEIAENNKEFGIISPLQMYKGSITPDYNFYNALPENLKEDISKKKYRENIYEVKFSKLIPAAHWLINCEVIKKVGGFSPLFFHRGEDNNYCHRLQFHGYKKGVVPSVIGIHDREGRNLATCVKHPALIKWKWMLSNPNLTFKYANKLVLKSIKELYYKRQKGLILMIIKLVYSYPKILKYKSKSRLKGAFLD